MEVLGKMGHFFTVFEIEPSISLRIGNHSLNHHICRRMTLKIALENDFCGAPVRSK